LFDDFHAERVFGLAHDILAELFSATTEHDAFTPVNAILACARILAGLLPWQQRMGKMIGGHS